MNFVAIDVETANPSLSSTCQIGIAPFRDGVRAGPRPRITLFTTSENDRMKKLLYLLLALALVLPAFPQAQPKPSSSPTPGATQPAATHGPCSADYYRNSSGVCVHRPTRTNNGAPPAGATALCTDGTYSFSQHRRGTCSHHGRVAKWL